MDTWQLVLSLIVGALGLYYFLFRNLNYFKDKGIPYTSTFPILGAWAPSFFRQVSFPVGMKMIYDKYPDAKYVGSFDLLNQPVVFVRDPEIIKIVAVKGFEHFPNHRNVVDETTDPLFGKNLFALQDEKWRDVRTLLSPAFTSSKMKGMFKLMSACAEDFANFMSAVPSKEKIMDIKDAFTKYTNDVIATCAFGISINTMKEPKNEFYVLGRDATTFNAARSLKFFFIRIFPTITRIFNVKIISDRVGKFFMNLIATTIKTRDEQGIYRPDMLQLMMESRGKRGPDRELSIMDMTSQAFIFFFGGFESTATLMCFAAHELAVNPDVQKRLQNEIDQVLKDSNGELTYEALNKMEYLDAVINEALRLYPVAPLLDRVCKEAYELPPAVPGAKPFVVQKNMSVWFCSYAMQRDPQYFEDPNTFDPDRFVGDNKAKINHDAYIPFGLGPRMCIGNRFALLETKVLLFHLLARCDLKTCVKTVVPMELTKKSFTMIPEKGFWLNVLPRANPVNGVANGCAISNGKDK